MEIPIQSIVVKSNPRTDFGDIEELTASVKEKGVLEPLLVKKVEDNQYELIAGERRLKAAKGANLETVPIRIYDGNEIDTEEVKLIENIQRKDLNPVEEAISFKQYLDTTKRDIDTLAKKISKPKIYIERRLELIKLPKEVQGALIDRKILLGHALVISRQETKEDQKSLLNDIIDDRLSVADTEDNLKYENNTELEDAKFDIKGCQKCKFNGGEQSILLDEGSILQGHCLNKKCFYAKTREWQKAEIKKLKDQGIKVLTQTELDNLKVKEKVETWHDDYEKINENLSKESENYCVVFDEDAESNGSYQIFCLNPKARKPDTEKGKATVTNDEKTKATNRKDKLKNKVAEFKRNFLIENTQSRVRPGTKETKAMILYSLLTEGQDWNDGNKRDFTDELIEKEKLEGEDSYCGYSQILALDEKDIDRITAIITTQWVKHLHDELGYASETFGVNVQEHFIITEDYLKLHTKDQLIDLAKEIKLHKHLKDKGTENWEKAKRDALINYFLNTGFELKGVVPKLMMK